MCRGHREGSQGELPVSDLRNSMTVKDAQLDKHRRGEGQILEERLLTQ